MSDKQIMKTDFIFKFLSMQHMSELLIADDKYYFNYHSINIISIFFIQLYISISYIYLNALSSHLSISNPFQNHVF